MIKVNHLSKKFGNLEVLKDINLDINEGEVVCIIGPSGSGKSTFLRCINQLERPTGGTVQYEGKNLLDKNCDIRKFREEVGMVFQKFNLFPLKTVVQNVMMAPILTKHMNKEEAHAKALELLDKVGLKDKADVYPSTLSGGQQQRVALARMMIGEPEAILLDEPFSALDGYLKDILQRDMQNFLKDYKGDMLMVTHSRDEAYKFCSQLNLLNNGKDILTGETRDIFENPQYLEAARLTGCKNFSAVQKMGSHEVYALDWELMLRSEQEVTEDITHVGIRGHWMRPADEAGENTMEVQVEEYIENTFEHQYLFRNKGAAESGTLWWMCQKKNFQETAKDNIPKYLYFPPEHVMLLKK